MRQFAVGNGVCHWRKINSETFGEARIFERRGEVKGQPENLVTDIHSPLKNIVTDFIEELGKQSFRSSPKNNFLKIILNSL